MNKIIPEKYENYSGYNQNWHKYFPVLKKRDYFVKKETVGGDQPKKFIQIYEYGEARRNSRKKWPSYIAKFGRKWYPLESITEYLLNRIGEAMCVNMAKSKLMIVNGQIRFLSRNFLKDNERLVHGADIYAKYLEDESFVKEVEKQKMERKLISYEFAEEAISLSFEENYDELMKEFTKMLIFDALAGVNDRHFYNWGIIVDIKGINPPRFSPVYDTSRGLLWNESEHKLQKIATSKKSIGKWVDGYIEKSMPTMHLESIGEVNHFTFIKKILEKYPIYKDICIEFKDSDSLGNVLRMIDGEFAPMLSKIRIEMIKLCLQKRFERILR